MIKIEEDKKYLSSLDFAAIENGYAELSIHSLRITNYFTEEQKQANFEESKRLTSEQWHKRCEQTRIQAEKQIKRIIDLINDNFVIYQYKNEDINYSNDDWDLFFWCNDGDMSYVTLNPNDRRSNEQQKEDIKRVIELLKTIDIEGVQVTVQYTVVYNEEQVKQASIEYCEKMKNQFIDYGGYIGKIVHSDAHGFLFRKKGAKKQAYHIDHKTILKNVLAI